MKNTLRICYNITHADDADGCACPVILSTVNTTLNSISETVSATVIDRVSNGDDAMKCAIEKFIKFCTFVVDKGFFPAWSCEFGGQSFSFLWNLRSDDTYFINDGKVEDIFDNDMTNTKLDLYITDISLSYVFDDELLSAISICKQAGIDMRIYHIDHHPTNPRFNRPVDSKWEGRLNCLIAPKTSFPEFRTGKDFKQRSAAYLLFTVLIKEYTDDIPKGIAQLLERFAYEISEADTYEFKNPPPEDVLLGLWRMTVPDSYALYYKTFGFVELFRMCIVSIQNRINRMDESQTLSNDYFRYVSEYGVDRVRLGVGFPDSLGDSKSDDVQQNGLQHVVCVLNTIRENEFKKVVQQATPYGILYNGKRYNGLLLYNVEASYNGNRILEESANNSENIDFVMIVYVPSMTVSLRSISDDVDVSKMAKAMGGGGRPRAAGFSIKDTPALFTKIMHGIPMDIR